LHSVITCYFYIDPVFLLLQEFLSERFSRGLGKKDVMHHVVIQAENRVTNSIKTEPWYILSARVELEGYPVIDYHFISPVLRG
jgi:hypothetical protein